MKLVTFELPGHPRPVRRVGAATASGIVDLAQAYTLSLAGRTERAEQVAEAILPSDMVQVIEGGDLAMEAMHEALRFVERAGAEECVLAESQVRLRACVPRPRTIRDFMTFESHAAGGPWPKPPDAWYEMPVYYKGNPDSVIGPGDPIRWPTRLTQQLDFELEFAAIVGRSGRNVEPSEGERYIFGYTIFNDVSARDIQMREMTAHLGPAKGKDFCNVLGPYLVTADEVDPNGMTMSARVNGEYWGGGRSSGRRFGVGDLVAHASRDETIRPGDLLGSGTVGGGSGAELGRWIQVGDVVELEITGLGVLRNPVVAGDDA